MDINNEKKFLELEALISKVFWKLPWEFLIMFMVEKNNPCFVLMPPLFSIDSFQS